MLIANSLSTGNRFYSNDNIINNETAQVSQCFLSRILKLYLPSNISVYKLIT